MPAAALIHRTAFDARLPWLAGLHTPEEDRAYWQNHLFPNAMVWGASVGDQLAGVMACRDGWIDQLYVLPSMQGRGLGGALVEIAQATFPTLQLWTFEKNRPARQFYESRGFSIVRQTDGTDNEEKEPDVLYRWVRLDSV